MFQPDLIVRSQRVVLNDLVRPAAIHIRRGKIAGVLDFDDVPAGVPVDDAGDHVVMAGLIDSGCLVRGATVPGAVLGAGCESETRAAAAGGVTTIISGSPDGGPDVTTVRGLEEMRRVLEGTCFVDVGFLGGVAPGNARELPGLAAAGVFGFTCSLAVPGEAESPAVSEADLRIAMPIIAKSGGTLHCGLGTPDCGLRIGDCGFRGARGAEGARGAKGAKGASDTGRRGLQSAILNPQSAMRWFRRLLSVAGFARRADRRYESYAASLPKEAENQAIALMIQLCREYGTRTHIMRLSSSDALAPIFHARAARLPITVETCPHYLTFVAEEIGDNAAALRCVPPIRSRENREYLWAALNGGLIQMVVAGESATSSLSLGLAATWTVAAARNGSIAQLAKWMCHAPARLAGLDRKGAIDVGYDADVVVWDPDAEFSVDGAEPGHHGHVTPYAGRRLRGVVQRTYLGGARIYERGGPMAAALGKVIRKGR